MLYLANLERPVHPVEIYRNAKLAGMDHPNSVLKAVKEMAGQNLVALEDVGTEEKRSYRCSLPNTRDAFLKLAKAFLESSERLPFLKSKYAQKMINPELVSYIQEHLKTYWDEKQKNAVLEVVKMSPSALHAVLFSEKTLSQVSDEVVRKEQPFVFKNPKQFEKLKEVANLSAFAILQSNLISDLFSNQMTRNENIRTCAITLETSFDSRLPNECAEKKDIGNILKLQTKQVVGYYTAVGPIKRGQLLSPITKKHKVKKHAE